MAHTLALSLSLLVDLDRRDLGDAGTDVSDACISTVTPRGGGDFGVVFDGEAEACLASRPLDDDLFSDLGDALTDALASVGLPLIVDELCMSVGGVGLLDRFLVLEKKRLSLGVFWWTGAGCGSASFSAPLS